MSSEQVPEISEALIKFLEKAVPEHSPEQAWTIEQCMWEGGCRNVVRFLRRMYDEQNQEQKDQPHVQP